MALPKVSGTIPFPVDAFGTLFSRALPVLRQSGTSPDFSRLCKDAFRGGVAIFEYSGVSLRSLPSQIFQRLADA